MYPPVSRVLEPPDQVVGFDETTQRHMPPLSAQLGAEPISTEYWMGYLMLIQCQVVLLRSGVSKWGIGLLIVFEEK